MLVVDLGAMHNGNGVGLTQSTLRDAQWVDSKALPCQNGKLTLLLR